MALLGMLAGGLVFGAVPALGAPEAPVTASPAQSITDSSAVLEGVLNPHASAKAGWYFAYSPGAECAGAFTAGGGEVDGEAVAEHAEATGLEPARKYMFCLVATNELGESSRGNEVSFETPPLAPQVLAGSENASNVTPFEEELGATLNANNEETHYSFEYATKATGETLEGTIATVDGESVIPPLEFGARGVGVSSGHALEPAKTYFYRVVAVNATGTTKGKVESFTTPAVSAPAVASQSVSAGSTTASIAATVNPDYQETTCVVQYLSEAEFLQSGYATPKSVPCQPSGPGIGEGDTPVEVSASLAGLEPAAGYHYRIVATNNTGETKSTDATFRTHALPPSATTAGVSEVTYNTATVTGTVDPNSTVPGSDTHWCFQYGTVESAEYNLGSLPLLAGDAGQGTSPVAVSVKLTGLEPGATYRYRLVAVNALGEGLESTACGTEGGQETDGAEATVTTPGTLPAPQSTTGSATGVAQNTATISGTIDPRGTRTSYEFQLGLDTSYGAQVYGEAGEGSEPESFSLPLASLQPETTYHYRIVAISGSGTIYGADETFTTAGYPTESLISPGSAPLIPTPVFAFPAQTSQTTKTNATTVKKKTKKKKTHKDKAGKGRKASTHRHVSKRRNG